VVVFNSDTDLSRAVFRVTADGYRQSEWITIADRQLEEDLLVTLRRMRRKTEIPPGTLEVLALNDAGEEIRPISVLVEAVKGEDNKEELFSEDGGDAARELPPGEYLITVFHPNDRFYLDGTATVEIHSGEVTTSQITLERAGNLVLEVKNHEGFFVDGFAVEMRSTAGGVTTETVHEGIGGRPGRMRLNAAFREGLYDLTVARGGYRKATEKVRIEPGQETFVAITLFPDR
jgi:hypothetical protein